jgi:hypothetical protein
MFVQNLEQTSSKKSTCCGSWITHYKRNLKLPQETNFPCSRKDCPGLGISAIANVVGAHVKVTGSRKHWIVPLCSFCNNQRGKVLEIRDDTKLVWANVGECQATPEEKKATRRMLRQVRRRNAKK